MKLIVISAETNIPDEHSIINAMFEAGLTVFHLRKPDWDTTAVSDLLSKVNSRFHPKIVLHDQYALTRDFNLRGIHKNERNASNWKQFAANGTKSVSCHSLEELRDVDHSFDYAFLSPVFNSISKTGYKGVFAPELLSKELPKNVPVIALGGIDATKVDLCEKLGFSGVAVLGAIWNDPNPVNAFKTIQQACQASVSTY